MIYFVQLPSTDIAFGFTDYWQIRLMVLRCKHGRIKLLHLMEGNHDTEAELYGRFAHLQLGTTGLFRPGYDLMKFIGGLRVAPPRPETGRWIYTASLGPRAIQHLLTAQGDELNN